MLQIVFIICLLGWVLSAGEEWKVIDGEIDPKFWENEARSHIAKSCKLFPTLKTDKKPKNVILFLGDGMGLPTIAASRFFIAELKGKNGSIEKHPFEKWPFNTLARTYDLETMVTDSASSANAYLTGSKTRTGMIGVTGKLNYQQCEVWPQEHYTHSVLEAASQAGKSTGILTTTRITHASPSGCYGHVTFRDFESDLDISKVCKDSYEKMVCQDLACQLVNFDRNQKINVMIGGGRRKFYPKDMTNPADSKPKGERLDGRNLVNEWVEIKKKQKVAYKVVENPNDFHSLDFDKIDALLGLPYEDHMPFANERSSDEPSLMQYTQMAIKLLRKNPKGYFLFVEGGRIDHAHHNNLGRHALEEMAEFDKAIEAAALMVNLEETLIIVTADHSHAFELIGQPSRFRNILDLDNGYSNKTLDTKPLTGIVYMNGPKGQVDTPRSDPSKEDVRSYDYGQQALVPLNYSTHGGDDVGVYATGPFSKLFHKTVDNTFIAQAMKFALGVEPYNNEPVCT